MLVWRILGWTRQGAKQSVPGLHQSCRAVRIKALGGADYKSAPRGDVETYGAKLAAHSGYKYFGAAKDRSGDGMSRCLNCEDLRHRWGNHEAAEKLEIYIPSFDSWWNHHDSHGQSVNPPILIVVFFESPLPWRNGSNGEDLPGVRELFETEIVPDAPRKTRRRSRWSYMNLLGGFKHCVLFFFPWCLPNGNHWVKKNGCLLFLLITQKHDKTWESLVTGDWFGLVQQWGIPPSSYLKMWKR
jgi:hypothetical protein